MYVTDCESEAQQRSAERSSYCVTYTAMAV